MLAALLAAVTDPTVPPSTQPGASADGVSQPATGSGLVGGIADVITGVVENLGKNGYQTGMAIVVTTAAIIAMLNRSVPRWMLGPVGIGAFWAGWLGWNTLSAQDNPLFPGDLEATKLWDVALTGDRGFLIVVIVACVAAIFVWKTSTALAGRLMLMLGAVLGASFLYNLVEAVRVA